MESSLLRDGGRAHFATRRFDRDGNDKLHVQTLCGLAHYDYCEPGGYAWEQAYVGARRLGLGQPALEQLFRRMVFNVVFRNQDDHTKNIAFVMLRSGQWALAPAYDLTYAYNPAGLWTHQHQMTINGKRQALTREDLLESAKRADIKPPRARAIIAETLAVAAGAVAYLDEAEVDRGHRDTVLAALYTEL